MPNSSPDADPLGSELAGAEQFTRRLAHRHYENFSVISLLLPRHLRQDFCNVYAYCRTADDLADEIGDRHESLRQLSAFRHQLHDCYAGRPNGPIFVALKSTIDRHAIPMQPFDDLLDAFEQDQRVTRYQTFAELVDYCRRSADPVGRLVLWMCGYRDPQRQRLSDRTCTALQLANFWQDVRRDLLDRDRIYLPAETMRRFGVSEDDLRQHIANRTCDDRCRQMIRFEVERTARMFDEGEMLLPMLDQSVRGQIGLFGAGGRAVLQSIRRRNFDTLSDRPALSQFQKGSLILSALMGRLKSAARPRPAQNVSAHPAEAKA
ncbi:MAG: squalene synthase HpnC [Phycisphaerae bacterium]|nr:squalene synthase HpnC [Phycisphaerae bacterium]